MVHYLDLDLLANVADNPTPMASTSLAPARSRAVANLPRSSADYLFYVDKLHLTSAGFAIVAPIYRDPARSAADASGDQRHRARHRAPVRPHADQPHGPGAPRDGDMPEGVQILLVGDTLPARSAPATQRQFRSSSVGAHRRGRVRLRIGRGRHRRSTIPSPRSTSATTPPRSTARSLPARRLRRLRDRRRRSSRPMPAMAGTSMTSIASAWSKSWTPIPTAATSLAGVKAGYLMPLGTVRVGPVVGARLCQRQGRRLYRRGRPGARPQRRRDRATSRFAAASARRFAATSAAMASSFALCLAAVEKNFTGDGRTFHFAADLARRRSSTAATVDNASKRAYGRFTGRAQRAIFRAVGIDVADRRPSARSRATKPRPSSACASASNAAIKKRAVPAGAAFFRA